MFIIGLTGSLATGKSCTAKAFEVLGAKVFDADREVHDLLKNDKKCIRQVSSVFKEVVKDGQIDRKILGGIVFKDSKALKCLEGIVHPLVGDRLKSFKKKNNRAKCIVLNIPLLFEGNLYKTTDINVVVKANQYIQIQRAVKSLKITRAEALRRIKAQMPIAEKIQLADEVIDNRGTIKQLEKQVKNIYLKYISI